MANSWPNAAYIPAEAGAGKCTSMRGGWITHGGSEPPAYTWKDCPSITIIFV